MNLTMVGLDGRPVQKGLRKILTEWIAFRLSTVERRTRHRLAKVLDRIHILEGRQQVLLNIDEVIRIIRNSDEPKPALIARFKLSDRQAEDILEIRLRQLARLEAIKIEQELKDCVTAGQARRHPRQPDGAEAHGDQGDRSRRQGPWRRRRTLVQEEKKAVAEVKVVDEPVTVVVSTKGWVRALKGHEVDAGDAGLQGRAMGSMAPFACRSGGHVLLVFGSNGRVYSVAVSPAARRARRRCAHHHADRPRSRVSRSRTTSPALPSTTLLLANSGGFGLLALAGDMVGRNRGGKAFLTLEAGDQAAAAGARGPAHKQVACLGRRPVAGLRPGRAEAAANGGGRGLTLMDVDAKTPLVSVATLADALKVLGLGRGQKAKEEVFKWSALADHIGKRARKGRAVAAFQKVLKVVAA